MFLFCFFLSRCNGFIILNIWKKSSHSLNFYNTALYVWRQWYISFSYGTTVYGRIIENGEPCRFWEKWRHQLLRMFHLVIISVCCEEIMWFKPCCNCYFIVGIAWKVWKFPWTSNIKVLLAVINLLASVQRYPRSRQCVLLFIQFFVLSSWLLTIFEWSFHVPRDSPSPLWCSSPKEIFFKMKLFFVEVKPLTWNHHAR